MEETKEFETLLSNLLKTHTQLPDKVAAVAINFSMQRFREQAWADNFQQPWAPRKEDRGRRRSIRRRRGLLTKTGRLRRSIRKITANSELVEIGTDVPYAEVHNEGFRGVVDVKEHSRNHYKRVKEKYTTRTGRERNRTVRQVDEDKAVSTVKAHRRRMNVKSRRFIGVSALLNTQLERLVTSEYMKILK